MSTLEELNRRIVACRACPRLVEWRQRVGRNPPKAYTGQSYWSRPLPGFGDPTASLLIVGLAPAAHGGNRTGRIFTGDRSATFLFEALHAAGLASKPDSVSRDDSVELAGAYLTAVVRCAPPANRPTPQERDNCLPYLVEEVELIRPRAILSLGGFAWDGVLRAARLASAELPSPKPRFFHGAKTEIRWRFRRLRRSRARSTPHRSEEHSITLVGSYHPSQQNTFTGKVTKEMLLDAIFAALSGTGQ